MSGFVCPDCDCQHFRTWHEEGGGKEFGQCLICGWEGEMTPFRTFLTDEDHARCHEMARLKADGRLFFLRIFLEDKDDTKDAMAKVAALLGGMLTWTNREGVALIQMEARPEDGLLKDMETLDGVKKVSLF